MESYRGQIYIDVPLDPEHADFKRLIAYFENPDGSMRLPHMKLYCLPLALAMKNAHHDEPGFWAKWLEDF